MKILKRKNRGGYSLYYSESVLETYLQICKGQESFQELLREKENKGSLAERLKILTEAGLIGVSGLPEDKRVKKYYAIEGGLFSLYVRWVRKETGKIKQGISEGGVRKSLSKEKWFEQLLEYQIENLTGKGRAKTFDWALWYFTAKILVHYFSSDVSNPEKDSMLKAMKTLSRVFFGKENLLDAHFK